MEGQLFVATPKVRLFGAWENSAEMTVLNKEVTLGRIEHAGRCVLALGHIPGHAGPAADDLQAVGNHQDGVFRVPAITRASCMRYDMSGHPDTPFGPSTVVHHPGTHSNMRSMSPDMLGRRPNVVSRYRDCAARFLRQKTCPSYRTRLPDVMDVSGTWPSTPGRFRPWARRLAPVIHPGFISRVSRP